VSSEFKTVDQLIEEGSHLDELEKLRWQRGQAAKQCAYLCFSSGTSGLPVCASYSPTQVRVADEFIFLERRHDFASEYDIRNSPT
jgi:hypothetical protein